LLVLCKTDISHPQVNIIRKSPKTDYKVTKICRYKYRGVDLQ
jgi:hypothetical protein